MAGGLKYPVWESLTSINVGNLPSQIESNRASWLKEQSSTNRPPKGDRSEGFYIKISIFLDFGLILLKIILFYIEIESELGGIRKILEHQSF